MAGEVAGYGYTIGVRHFTLEDLDNQPEMLLDPAGKAIEFRDEDADIIPQQTTVTANAEKTFGAWQTRANNEFLYSDFIFREVSPAFGVSTRNFLRRNNTRVNDEILRGEIGADAERSWSGSPSLKLIGLQTLQRFDGPRSDGIVRAVEVRDRTPETRVVLSARRAF